VRQSAVRRNPPGGREWPAARQGFPSGRSGLSRHRARSAPRGSARREDLPPGKERRSRSPRDPVARPRTQADRVPRSPGVQMAGSSSARSAVSVRAAADAAGRRDSKLPAENY